MDEIRGAGKAPRKAYSYMLTESQGPRNEEVRRLRKPHTQGITLVECIVAVAILAFAVAGPMTLASASLRASRDARNELIATHLAEEGIEAIHSIRDNNSADDNTIDHNKWTQNLLNKCDNGCVIDITDHAANVWANSALVQCPGGDCTSVEKIYENKASGLYRQGNGAFSLASWDLTPFKRNMKVTGIDSMSNPSRQIHVVSTVTYAGYGGKLRTVSIGDDLYNWFPPLN